MKARWLQIAVAVGILLGQIAHSAENVKLEKVTTKSGYLATLLINEVPFPGENSYVSEAESQEAMLAILWVLHARIHYIPSGYKQKQVAGVQSTDIIDVITGTGGRRQCEGFYRDEKGNFICAARVTERIDYLLAIANKDSKPGRFSRLLNHAKGLADAYFKSGIKGADRYAQLKQVGTVNVTGRAYSWMTDRSYFNPGGNFVTIPDKEESSVGGNRFFTLRKDPK